MSTVSTFIYAGERFPVRVRVLPKANASFGEGSFLLHFRQRNMDSLDKVYGAVNLLIRTHEGGSVPIESYFRPNENTGDALEVFPNPAQDELTIRLLKGEAQTADIRILDVSGKEVFLTQTRLSYTGAKINTAHLSPGIYFGSRNQ